MTDREHWGGKPYLTEPADPPSPLTYRQSLDEIEPDILTPYQRGYAEGFDAARAPDAGLRAASESLSQGVALRVSWDELDRLNREYAALVSSPAPAGLDVRERVEQTLAAWELEPVWTRPDVVAAIRAALYVEEVRAATRPAEDAGT